MFCKNCGKEIDDRAYVCPHCGVQVGSAPNIGAPNYNARPQPTYRDTSNTIAVVGFVCSFFFTIVGLICSIIGYNKAKNEGLDHKGLALAGIIISAVSLGIGLLISILYGSVIIGIIAGAGTYY